jgi:hypothetical protein
VLAVEGWRRTVEEVARHEEQVRTKRNPKLHEIKKETFTTEYSLPIW